MSAVVISLADRQPQAVQRRAIAAVARQRLRTTRKLTLGEILEKRVDLRYGFDSLDDWYRAQPIGPGRIRRQLCLSPEVAQLYGLPRSARLVDLCGMGEQATTAVVLTMATVGGYIVGVKGRDGAGVGVLWRTAAKANAYARRLAKKHELPIREGRP